MGRGDWWAVHGVAKSQTLTEHLSLYNNQLHNLFWITDKKVIFSNSYYKVGIILISKSDKTIEKERERGRNEGEKEGKKEGRRDPGLSHVGLANETSCRTEV